MKRLNDLTETALVEMLQKHTTKKDFYSEVLNTASQPNSRTLKKIKDKVLNLTGNTLDHYFPTKGRIEKTCPVCGKPFSTTKSKEATTCSHTCSNTYFRSGMDNGNYTGTNYRTICFSYHKKECIVCGEKLVVEVHHYDNDHNNNAPCNLIPLCPTHHQYLHSKHAHLLRDIVKKYKDSFKGYLKARCSHNSLLSCRHKTVGMEPRGSNPPIPTTFRGIYE